MAAHHIAAHHSPAHKLAVMEKKEAHRVESEHTTARRVVSALANNTGTFAMGVLHGRKGGMPETYGVPWDIGLGLLITGLGFAMGASKSKTVEMAADPFIAFGTGMTGYFAGSMGAMLGQNMRKNAGELTGVAYTPDQATAAGVQVRTVVAGPVAGAPMFQPQYAPQYGQPYYPAPQQSPMWNFAHLGM